MNTPRSKKTRLPARRRPRRKRQPEPLKTLDLEECRTREKHFEILAIIALFAFGVYHSVLYFGHTVVPISDFPDLYRVGRDILSLRLPARFKQAPVLGMLQVGCSYIVGGPDPNLKAGWLLNALLHPFNAVLLYLVAKQILGKSGLWLALLAILNPWIIYLLTEPIVETTYLFFILLTLYFMFRRSAWCYLFASITSMVRYEGAALILAAFVLDVVHAGNNRQRLKALGFSALAAVPLGLWMLGTILTWQPGSSHYLNVFSKSYKKAFGASAQNRTGLLLHLNLLWHVGFRPLLAPVTELKGMLRLTTPTAAQVRSVQAFYTVSKLLALAGTICGALSGLAKRNWKIVALLIFFVPYFILHAFYPYPLQRFHATIFWIALLLCWFGLLQVWNLLDAGRRVPRAVRLSLQAAVLVVALGWLVTLWPYMSKISPVSPPSRSVPYVAIALAGVLAAGRLYVYRLRHLLRELSTVAVLSLMIVSNQFRLVPLVNDGQRDAEFKLLAEWYTDYAENTDSPEKMGVYMAPIVGMFAPEYAEYIVRLPAADSPEAFVKACRAENITFVVWATREGLGQHHTGYKQLGLDKNIAVLRNGKSVGPYEFVKQLRAKRGYVNIYRLRKADPTKPSD